MTTWFTADLHFGHVNIIDYCRRPYRDVDEMNMALIRNWNAVVAPHDRVWVIGDVALGRIAVTLPLVAELAGHKILVPGNHDRCWSGHANWRTWVDRYLQAGFAAVLNTSRDQPLLVRVGEHTALMSHFPYDHDYKGRADLDEHRPRDDGAWLLHGHTHGLWRQQGRQIDVGVDAIGYFPVHEDEVAAMIHRGPFSIEVPGADTPAASER